MLNIPIIYEDDDVVVINKPSGLIVHQDGVRSEPSVADWVAASYPMARGVGEPLVLSSGLHVERSGIVHRIDKETSGILLCVKVKSAFEYYKTLFQSRSMRKEYVLFCYGVPRVLRGRIDAPIGKSATDFRLRSAEKGARGVLRDAVTEYEVITSSDDVAYVCVRPQTGRMHQIRVHFKLLGHPIVADKLYAKGRVPILGFNRLALHARTLSFTTRDGLSLTLEAPIPSDFEKALSLIQNKHLVA